MLFQEMIRRILGNSGSELDSLQTNKTVWEHVSLGLDYFEKTLLGKTFFNNNNKLHLSSPTD